VIWYYKGMLFAYRIPLADKFLDLHAIVPTEFELNDWNQRTNKECETIIISERSKQIKFAIKHSKVSQART